VANKVTGPHLAGGLRQPWPRLATGQKEEEEKKEKKRKERRGERKIISWNCSLEQETTFVYFLFLFQICS